MFILKVCKTLDDYEVPFAVVGGHAVNLHGAVRGTVDIDFILKLTKKNLINCELALKKIGLISRLPVGAEEIFNFKNEYINNKNLIAWNFYNPIDPTEQIDILIILDLKKKKTVLKKVQGYDIVVLAKDELIKMKLEAGRDQDLIDVEALKRL